MGRVAAALMIAMAASSTQAEPACLTAGDAAIDVAGIEAQLELRLADGRRLRLVGVDPATRTPTDPDLDESARATLATAIARKGLTARFLSEKPDRWGRLPAIVFVDGDASPGGLAAVALASGSARFRPEPAAHDCRDALLAAERQARSANLGLWRDPYYGVLAADDRQAFAERAATDVVFEGRLWRVDAGPFRTKLRFVAPGDRKHGLLVAVVLPKVVKRFEEQGVHFEALIGQPLRLRGLLDLRFGPQIEIAGPDSLELSTETPARSASQIVPPTSSTSPVGATP